MNNMKFSKSASAFVMFMATCGSSMAAAESTSKTDLTTIFQGMEKDCASTNHEFEALLGWLTTQSGKPPAVVKANTKVQVAVGTARIKVKDDGDFWTLTVPTIGASYRGAALASIDRWVGKDNGINGISLTFAGSLPNVSKIIGKVKHTNDGSDQVQPRLLAEKGTARAVLMCDFSS